jgi:hypothetical protein
MGNNDQIRAIHAMIMQLREAFEEDDDAALERVIEELEAAVAHVTELPPDPQD